MAQFPLENIKYNDTCPETYEGESLDWRYRFMVDAPMISEKEFYQENGIL
jgi:hypothetical protein